MTGACRELAELRRSDEPAFGGKSAGLGELLAAGIPVPPGFGISADAFRSFMASGIDPSREAIGAAPLPEELRAEVAERYGRLGREEPVAVRSSAVGEDSSEASFAGQQETYLWVRGADAVLDAVRDCWASLYSAPAVAYRARLGDAAPSPAMGVTVQRMVDAEISGVLFTCNPVSGDPSMVAVNASWGLGLAVVGGEVTPDDYLVSKVTGEVVRAQVSEKLVQYVPRGDGRGAHAVEVEEPRRSERCLDEEKLRALVEIAQRVQRHFGSHQDVEWAIARGSGEVFVVQSRPVTAIRQTEQAPAASAMSLIMKTFGADAQ